MGGLRFPKWDPVKWDPVSDFKWAGLPALLADAALLPVLNVPRREK